MQHVNWGYIYIYIYKYYIHCSMNFSKIYFIRILMLFNKMTNMSFNRKLLVIFCQPDKASLSWRLFKYIIMNFSIYKYFVNNSTISVKILNWHLTTYLLLSNFWTTFTISWKKKSLIDNEHLIRYYKPSEDWLTTIHIHLHNRQERLW